MFIHIYFYISKDRRGVFDGHIDQAICGTLLDAGLPFLLRWSLDDSTDTLIAASVKCLTGILVLQRDEVPTNTKLIPRDFCRHGRMPRQKLRLVHG